MAVNNRLAGVIGLSISVTLWIIALWRVVFHLVFCKDPQNERKYMTPRRVFHALLWIAMTLECVAYANVAGLIAVSHDPSFAVKVGYVLLEVIGRAVFEFLAFSAVTFLWFETAKDVSNGAENNNRLLDPLPRILFGTGVILCVASIWEAIDMLTLSKEARWLFRGHILLESLAWGIHAIMAAICTWLTALRISRLCSTLPQSDDWTTFKVVSKPLVPMVLCAVCYAIRAIWLFCLFVTMPKTANLPNHRYGVAWWIGFCWIPTLVPSTMLLYSARKRDPTPDQQQDDAHLAHPLLPTPVPPMEAFIAFRKFRENHDLFSPLSMDPRADDEHDFDPPEGECRQLDYSEVENDGTGEKENETETLLREVHTAERKWGLFGQT